MDLKGKPYTPRAWHQDGKLRLLYEAAPMSFLLEQVEAFV